MTLNELNRADASAFVALLGGVFEHSPWVAERAWAARPFASRDALHAAMKHVVKAAGREAQLALIREHPELAGRESAEGTLTADSTSEQGRLGFSALAGAEVDRMRGLNRRYRARFGFPCIVALHLHASRDSVLAEFETRIGNDSEAEIANALEQICHIARGRLDQLVDED